MKKLLIVLIAIFGILFQSCTPGQQQMDPSVWNTFLTSLTDKRQYAMKRDSGDLRYLIKALEHDYWVVRFNAAHDLRKMGYKAKPAANALINRFDDPNQKVALMSYKAIHSIGTLDSESVPALTSKLQSHNSSARKEAIASLIKMGDQASTAAPELISCLGHSDPVVQRGAEKILLSLSDDSDVTSNSLDIFSGKDEPTTVTGLLIKGLADSNPTICAKSAVILGQRRATDAVPLFVGLLDEENPKLRLSGAWALAHLGAPERKDDVIAILESSLKSPNLGTRETSATLLSKLGKSQIVQSYRSSKAKRTKTVTKRKSHSHRSKSISKRKHSSPKNSQIAWTAERVLRKYAAEQLERLTPGQTNDWRMRIPYYRSVLQSGSPRKRRAAVDTLGNMAIYLDDAIPPLVQALENSEDSVRILAAITLGQLRTVHAVGPLTKILEEPQLRGPATAALQAIGTPNAVRAARNASRETSPEELREWSQKIRGNRKNYLNSFPPIRGSEARELCRLILQDDGIRGGTLERQVEQCVRATGAAF